MKNYLFPKNYMGRPAEELMMLCKELGIDGPTALIRDGYWMQADNMKETLPAFVRLAEQYGLEVVYAETPFQMEKLPELDDKLAVMADCGIRQFRVDFFAKNAVPARELAGRLARMTETAAKAADRHGLRAVVQLHGGAYPHSATAAWPAVKNLDPRYIGVKLDPGTNLLQEGYEDFSYQIGLLGEYIAAIGEKDGAVFREHPSETGAKGWTSRWVPSQQGMINYDSIFALLKKQNLDIPGILMPFYDEGALQEEVAYFLRCQREAGLS